MNWNAVDWYPAFKHVESVHQIKTLASASENVHHYNTVKIYLCIVAIKTIDAYDLTLCGNPSFPTMI